MTARSSDHEDAVWDGYLRGVETGAQSGHAAGYAEGLAVLNDAARVLAETKPSRAVEWAAARTRHGTYRTSAQKGDQTRAEAARSWGLTPLPS